MAGIAVSLQNDTHRRHPTNQHGRRAVGRLIEGVWHTTDQLAARDGRFQRAESSFRQQISADGSSDFPAEAGRYHLYVSLACPWAHRTLIFRKLKELEDAVSVSVVHPVMGDDGWAFGDFPGATPDTLNDSRYLRDIYLLANPGYTGRVTVPVLWDKTRGTIVNNESAEIVRMLNSAFAGVAGNDIDFYPANLQDDIDATNGLVYETVNNGVYKCGFARSQAAYDEAFESLFTTLDSLEERLSTQRYLVGKQQTEADWRLFTTLLRFDPVYFGHFKCNRRRLVDYPNLWGYTRDLFETPGVAETVNMDHIKTHYYVSHRAINPSGIVPRGPEIDFTILHDRDRLS
jgi:putative glutathione S-transferase